MDMACILMVEGMGLVEECLLKEWSEVEGMDMEERPSKETPEVEGMNMEGMDMVEDMMAEVVEREHDSVVLVRH
jgi:hypothetical protein